MGKLGNQPKNQPIYVKRGSAWTATFWFTNPDGTTADLTGSSFVGDIKRTKLSETVAASFVFTINLSTNKVVVTLPPAISAAMEAGELDTDDASRYVYDWKWIQSDDTPDMFQEGILILNAGVTEYE